MELKDEPYYFSYLVGVGAEEGETKLLVVLREPLGAEIEFGLAK